jgi:hypothetical protein
MKPSLPALSKKLPLALVSSLLAGAAMEAWLPGGGSFVIGWLATSVLLLASQVVLYLAWKAAGAGRLLGWLVTLAFLLRLVCGLALTLTIPVYGHGSPEELAGHIFTDAYKRDQAAWELAKSNTSLLSVFRQDFVSDQYGGLLALSAGVYRYLSPDAHRPYLIQLLAALAAALGVPFLWAAVRKRWGEGVAKTAAWIMVLYPESILLGSYQMREPFLISLAAIAFWAVITWPRRRVLTILVFAASVAGMALFSLSAFPIAGFCLAWLLLDQISRAASLRWKIIGWLSLVVAGVAMVGLTWEWLFNRTNWDILVTIHNSGQLQALTENMGNYAKQLFVIGYGVAQPVLPAALIDRAPAIWQVIGILRAVGWYALVPVLAYGVFVVWKAPAGKERRAMVLLAIVVWAWIIISSMRGGGDQWDNPRYRTIFLPWLALLTAFAWEWGRKYHDPWLWRWVAVEAIFVLVFTEWYLGRFFPAFQVLSFKTMGLLIGGLSFLVFFGGWAWDHFHKRRSLPM